MGASPQFVQTPKVSSVLVTAANTRSDGNGTIGTDIFKVATGVGDGTYIDRITVAPTATVANTATAATALRLFLSSVSSGATTSADTYLIRGEFLVSITAASSTSQDNCFDIALGITIPAGYTLLATCHTAPATNTAWRVTAYTGDW